MRDPNDDLFPGAPSPKEEAGPEKEPEFVERPCAIHVFNRDRRVIITFDPPPEFLTLPPGDAMRLGREIIQRAQRAMRGGGGRVPKA